MDKKTGLGRGRVCVLALLLVTSLSGCGIKLVYNQLDWLVPWYLDDYLSLDGKQDAFFDKRLKSYLAWHRKTQLPEYAVFLRSVAVDVEDGVSEEELLTLQDRTEVLGRVLMERLAPDIVSLFASATDKQLKALYTTLDKDGEGFRKRYAKLSERQQQKKQVTEVIEAVERWTGSLSDKQETMIADWGRHYRPMSDELVQAGLAWRAEFKQVLELRKTPELYEMRLYHLLTTTDFGWSDDFKKKAEDNKRSLTQLYFALDKTFSSKQRGRIIKTLQSYANDFEQLSKDG